MIAVLGSELEILEDIINKKKMNLNVLLQMIIQTAK